MSSILAIETTDKMTIIGENFKKRLRAQIGGVK